MISIDKVICLEKLNKFKKIDIKHIFLKKDNKLNATRCHKSWIQKFPNLNKFILNYFSKKEWISYNATIKRIIYNLPFPKCKTCGKSLDDPLKQYCCTSCQAKNPENKRKVAKTKFKKYGDSNFNNREQCKRTLIKRYGKDYQKKINKKVSDTKQRKNKNKNYLNSWLNKMKETNQKRHGYNFPLEDRECREKGKITRFLKYGNYNNIKKQKETVCKNKEKDPLYYDKIQQKIRNTRKKHYGDENYGLFGSKSFKEKMITKYGVSSYSKTEDFKKIMKNKDQTKRKNSLKTFYSDPKRKQSKLDKEFATRKKNNTLNSSKLEQKIKKYLETLFKKDVNYQYKDKNRYPFRCDFYIKSLDLFLECNFHWTHGGHKYNPKNKEDKKLANKWKNSKSKYENGAYHTWVELDIKKYKTAKKNNLNYLAFYKEQEVYDYFLKKGYRI